MSWDWECIFDLHLPYGTLAELKELEDNQQLRFDVHLGLVARIEVESGANNAIRIAIIYDEAQIPLHQCTPDILGGKEVKKR